MEIETETESKHYHRLTTCHRCTMPWRDRMWRNFLGLEEPSEAERRAERKSWAASIFYGCYFEIM